jgi:hypothetical protein
MAKSRLQIMKLLIMQLSSHSCHFYPYQGQTASVV